MTLATRSGPQSVKLRNARSTQVPTNGPVVPWVLLAPAILFLAVFTVWPSLNTIRVAFTDTTPLGGGDYIGFDNFAAMAQDPQVVNALLNSVVFMIVCLPLLIILPLLIAMLVLKALPGIAFFRIAYYTPVIASAVVVGLVWQWMLNDRGLINNLALQLGVLQTPMPFLTERWLLILSAIALTVWQGLGYYMIIYMAALGNVDRNLYEAAAVDGAGAIRRFISVTIPGVRRTMTLIGILVSVSALRVFSEIYVLSGGTGGPGGQAMTLVMLIQQYSRGFFGDLGYAATLSILLFLVTLVPLIVLARLNKGDD
ncbi:sugar ABC transporter permease [Nesterenkonia sp. HG001]|uniref:carbohydrate ABC transporter permease n=1 Tax=Nesterenkonia sp. HG001 TaxID=2983207 RepID=UPI002AC683D2|nr:sugar ABC transporter permease [Nesterenkonia sp. HG001]MDZ5076896.1 sugar ABC transporter permease [Nesterenkonia sp. HG001]